MQDLVARRIRIACLAVVTSTCLAFTLGCARQEQDSRVFAAGHVEATDVRLAAKVGGRLEWFPIEEGDRIEAGQEIARIDTVDLELALDATRAERRLAAAELDLRQSGFRPEEVAEAEAGVEAARASLEAARRDLERFQGLLDASSGTGKSRDDAETRRPGSWRRRSSACKSSAPDSAARRSRPHGPAWRSSRRASPRSSSRSATRR